MEHCVYFYCYGAGGVSKWLFTSTNIKYPAVYLQCFYINAIKMHKGRFSLSFSGIFFCPFSLYASVLPLLLDMLHNCLLVCFISNPLCDMFAGHPWLFHSSIPSERILFFSHTFTELAAVLVL